MEVNDTRIGALDRTSLAETDGLQENTWPRLPTVDVDETALVSSVSLDWD